MKKLPFKIPKTFDWLLFLIPIVLISTGITVIYSFTYYNDQIDLVYSQILFAVVGLIIMIVLTFIDYHNYKNFAWLFYLIGVILLILVLLIGKSSFGAKRWIDLGFYDLQPSEFMKLFIIFALAALFSDHVGEVSVQRIISGLVLIAVPASLILLQPDFGSTVVLVVIGLSVILFSRINKWQVIGLATGALALLPVAWLMLKDYQKERVYTFLNPVADRFGAGYNVIQSMITVGSGGLMGKGFGHGPQSQLNFLPVAHTDFIFSGLAEAAGFVGSVVLIALFALLIFRIVNVAKISRDYFGMLLAIGIGAMFLFQIFVNIGMNLGIMPVTGITLPLVSYGGSSLILNMAAIGILQSIYLRHKRISF